MAQNETSFFTLIKLLDNLGKVIKSTVQSYVTGESIGNAHLTRVRRTNCRATISVAHCAE